MNNRANNRLARLRDDAYLHPFLPALEQRSQHAAWLESNLTGGHMSLAEFANAHEYFGLHRRHGQIVFREWAPNATAITLIGDFTDWRILDPYRLHPVGNGVWEISLPPDSLRHGQLYRLHVEWPGGAGPRIPAYTRRVVQDPVTNIFNAQAWLPPEPFRWHTDFRIPPDFFPVIYESHVGMAQEAERVGSYNEFRTHILPRIVKAGYNTLQLMALQEHPYYGSFGYHVSSYFAASSRFGTPEELKALIDAAHQAGIAVIMDLVHSHSVRNEVEGLSRFDGTLYQYFHDGERGSHLAWDSRCFDYGKHQVVHFLLSNCRFWLDEFRIDGFRFDGVTSMLYLHRGLGCAFDSYDRYFNDSVDEAAVAYLTLANKVIHQVRPDAITIAEDVSGMPGLAAPTSDGGCGFNFRLAMGVPDCWFKLANDVPDENWSMGYLWHELVNRRLDEQTISYVESHDQALVGGKTMIFELIDAPMYSHMRKSDTHIDVDRGIALHKMMRLTTLSTAAHGYLNFMGNEFGHPEWVDFPREGNGWSYRYAQRKWSLRDNQDLKYHWLAEFDQALLEALAHHPDLQRCTPLLLHLSEPDKVIAFGRGRLFVVINFHASHSYTDYAFKAMPGEYAHLLNTDEPRFGGQGLIRTDMHHFAVNHQIGDQLTHLLPVYIPARTAILLERIVSSDPGSPTPGSAPVP